MTDLSMDRSMDQPTPPTVAFTLRPIGLVRTAPRKRARLPKYFVPGGRATLELFHPYRAGLQGLYEGTEVWVVTFQAPSGQAIRETWPTAEGLPGVFATTSLDRPNPIEFLRARIRDLDPEKGVLHVMGLDLEDGAPVLDIRPVTAPHHPLTRTSERELS